MADETKRMSDHELVEVAAETMAGAMRRVPLAECDELARVIAVAALAHLRITQGDDWLQAFVAGVIDYRVPPCRRPTKH